MIADRNSPSEEERLLRLAADDALTRHVSMIIENWMVDDEDQPERAFRGIQKAVNIWHEAIKAIDVGEI
jgi:hypothetical protein